MEQLVLAAAAVLTALLARKLCGESAAALPAAAIYVLSPPVRTLAHTELRLAAALAVIPALLLLFYWMTNAPLDAPPSVRRRRIAALALFMAAAGAVDPRFAVTGALLVWLILLTGYYMDSRRRSLVWGPPFGSWALACVFAIALYAPLWWWRRQQPGALGGPLASFPLSGCDFTALWTPSPAYIGIGAVGLTAAALSWTRSYRGPVRLWAFLSGLFIWMALGPRFLFNDNYHWWVPVLYRGALKMPWLGRIEPPIFAAAGQLSLALLAAFGFGALLTRMPPRSLRWARPAAAVALTAALAADLLRF